MQLDDGGIPDAKREAEKTAIMGAAGKFLGDEDLVKESRRAMALFEMIYSKGLKIDPGDLTVKMRQKDTANRKGKDVTISIIDYISVLVDSDGPDTKDDKLLYSFHNYLKSKGAVLPRIFVLNRNYWTRDDHGEEEAEADDEEGREESDLDDDDDDEEEETQKQQRKRKKK